MSCDRTDLFPGVVGALSCVWVVAGPVEGHEGLAVAPLVVHLVALLDLDAVHLDRAPVLRSHEDLRAHHLTCKGK